MLCFWMLCVCAGVHAQEIGYNWQLVAPKYATADAFVAGLNVMDYGADPAGNTDQTALFQRLLDFLGSRTINKGTKEDGTPNGGTLFLPEGKYLINGSLVIPKGVTLRGEWEKPVKGQPVKGTILLAATTNAKGKDCTQLPNGTLATAYEQLSLITLQPSSAVRDINIWYPEQDANNIVAFPPAILFGQQGYWGNDYTLVSNITLVNAFDGVIFSRRAGGGAPNCYGIYGTPLRRGIEIDNIAEVGRIDNVDFSPDYWAGSGLPGSPAVNGAHKQYIRQNGTAVVMRRNDWSFICKVKAEGYKIGYHLGVSYNPERADNENYTSPNGHNYGMEFTDCKYGVFIEAVSGAGMMFYEYKFNNCDYGFFLTRANTAPNGKTPANSPWYGVIQVQGSVFDTNIASVYAPEENGTKIMMNQNTFDAGAVDVRGGLISIVNCDFNSEPDHIVLGARARAIITGNRFKEESGIKNVSMYKCIIDHNPVEMTELPHFPYKNQYDFVQKPAGNAFYTANVSAGLDISNTDNSDALQALLNQAGNGGGGVVFLPPGHYSFRKPITIPSGVELKGSVDVPSLPTGPGSVMEIYAGKGDENGTPFITMEQGSGLRGLVMNYPEQAIQLLTEPELNGGDIYHYPYTIRGNKDVYIVNVALRTSYHGLDLFTNKCDNHFVDYLAGHVFKTGIRVGGSSEGGHIYNSQFNQIAYGSGGETKFGAWANSPNNNNPVRSVYTKEHAYAYGYCWNNLYFMIIENCANQVLYNNFDFGSNRGFTLGAGANGICLGQGIDQGMNSFYIDGVGDEGFKFINTQIVTTAPGQGATDPGTSGSSDEYYDRLHNWFMRNYLNQAYRDNNRYIQTTSNLNGKVTFFGVDFWGQPQNISNEVLGGTLEMQAGNYDNPGQKNFASIASGATFNITGSNINNIGLLLESAASAPQFYVQSSMVNQANVITADCGLWLNNLGLTASVSPDAGAFISRTGWIATASTSNDDAQKSLDGDTETRWSSLNERQKPGQWFMVDMIENQTFTGIYIDAGSNTYRPVSVNVSVSADGENWTQLASGNNFTQANFVKQTARYIRVEQTGTGSSSWRIAEFYVMNTDLTAKPEIKGDRADVRAWFAEGRLYINGLTGKSSAKIYSVAGQLAAPVMTVSDSAPVNLPLGIYIVEIQNSGNIYQKKIIKNRN
ncbi:MAG: discoidin domain-containing protein [Dysgonamonadaceae bacterium]|nr:discoidin domain-containing protein [Dysgonamonadaceae bacterium]